MGKFWSVLFFAVAMVGTWFLINGPSNVGTETHSGIQNELAKLITDTVKSKKPEAQDIRITKMWTEAAGENKVRAIFAYAFSETVENEKIEQGVQGEAVLHREASADSRQDRWVLQEVKTNSDSLSFNEGTVVGPVATADEVDPTAPAGTGPTDTTTTTTTTTAPPANHK